jgi:hypothetical protein
MKKLPKQKLITISLALILFLTAFFLTKKIQAQTILPLTVAPARQELLVDPGETTAIVLKFLNQGEVPVSGLLKVADFIVEDKEGSPTFLEDETYFSSRFAAASWVELPYDRITIAAKDKVTIQAKINVPQDAQAGGRYFAIFFEPGGRVTESLGEETEAETPVTIRLAGLVYLRVAGPIEENAYLTQLTTPRFLEYGPIPVTTEIENQGNYHIRPQGTVTLTSIFGKKVDEEILREQNIFPETSRIFENKLGGKWLFGKYKIELNAVYGETGKILTASVFTWIIPWKMITITVVAIIIIILLVSLLYHRLKKREKNLEEKIEELEEKLEEKKSE